MSIPRYTCLTDLKAKGHLYYFAVALLWITMPLLSRLIWYFIPIPYVAIVVLSAASFLITFIGAQVYVHPHHFVSFQIIWWVADTCKLGHYIFVMQVLLILFLIHRFYHFLVLLTLPGVSISIVPRRVGTRHAQTHMERGGIPWHRRQHYE